MFLTFTVRQRALSSSRTFNLSRCSACALTTSNRPRVALFNYRIAFVACNRLLSKHLSYRKKIERIKNNQKKKKKKKKNKIENKRQTNIYVENTPENVL